MALSSGTNPVLDGVGVYENTITANNTEAGANRIYPPTQNVVVAGVTNNANDFIWLPSLADVPIGHRIVINNQSGSHCYLRTPASSNEKINDIDCDGTNKYPLTNTNVVILTKRTSTGWVAQEFTNLGAAVTTVPGALSASPSASPSGSPSKSPSASPSVSASASPSGSPSASPSGSPSNSPSASPSASVSPSNSPSASPSTSTSPSISPSSSPSASASPSNSPSSSPSASASPSVSPSKSPSNSPSVSPSASPSFSPSP